MGKHKTAAQESSFRSGVSMPVTLASPEISASLCLLGSWRCTSGDAAGQVGCIIFMVIGCVASLINAVKNRSGARANSDGTARHANFALKYVLWVVLGFCMYMG